MVASFQLLYSVEFSSCVGDQANHHFVYEIDENVWNAIEIEQEKSSDQIWFSIRINGNVVHSVVNDTPIPMTGLNLWAASHDRPATFATIRDWRYYSLGCK